MVGYDGVRRECVTLWTAGVLRLRLLARTELHRRHHNHLTLRTAWVLRLLVLAHGEAVIVVSYPSQSLYGGCVPSCLRKSCACEKSPS